MTDNDSEDSDELDERGDHLEAAFGVESPQSSETVEKDETFEIESSERTVEEESSVESFETSQTSERRESDSSGATVSRVQQERKGVQMFLPEEMVEKMRQRYKLLDAEHDMEYGEDLEKNRHYYPLIVSLGLEQLEEMSIEKIHDRL